jgi:hypothetical protein
LKKGRHSTRPPEGGQATLEVLGALPAMLLLGVVLMQLLAVGHAAVLAGAAAEAGALALAGGGQAEDAARRAVPGGGRARLRVAVRAGTVRVSLQPRSLVAAASRRFEVRASATVATP